MNEETKKAFEDIMESQTNYQFDAKKYVLERIVQLVDDKEIRNQLIEDCDKEFYLALNMVGFVRANAEQFIMFCKHEQDIINKTKEK